MWRCCSSSPCLNSDPLRLLCKTLIVGCAQGAQGARRAAGRGRATGGCHAGVGGEGTARRSFAAAHRSCRDQGEALPLLGCVSVQSDCSRPLSLIRPLAKVSTTGGWINTLFACLAASLMRLIRSEYGEALDAACRTSCCMSGHCMCTCACSGQSGEMRATSADLARKNSVLRSR